MSELKNDFNSSPRRVDDSAQHEAHDRRTPLGARRMEAPVQPLRRQDPLPTPPALAVGLLITHSKSASDQLRE